ncbi:MAG: hypothetical protein EBS07_04465 [Sphingobacteriia bacterium]|nr:hypothetical protein [Sphingobacteriia bacterium]
MKRIDTLLLRTLGFLVIFLLIAPSVFAQSDAGKLTGKVKDKDTGEELLEAVIYVSQNGIFKAGAKSDYEGNYSVAPLSPGQYDVRVSYAGKNVEFKNVLIVAGKTQELNIDIRVTSQTEVLEITEYKVPLIEKDNTSTGSTVTQDQLKHMGTRNPLSIAANSTPGVFQADDGRGINVRGSRAEETQYFVDGQRVRGTRNLPPQRSIAQLNVVTSGTPAEFGDLTGGVISISTSAPSSVTSGGVEVQTSRLFDKYQYDLIGANLSGPILTKKGEAGSRQTLLGYFINGEAELQGDPSPSAIGVYRLKDGKLDDLEKNPLRLSSDGSFFLNNSNFLRASDLENVPNRSNARFNSYRANGRLDFQPSLNTSVKVGFNFNKNYFNNWGLNTALLSPKAISITDENTYRGWARFQQTLPGDTASLVKNLFYSIQADYTLRSAFSGDPNWKENAFDYGYIGKFDLKRAEVFEYNDSPDPRYSNTPYYQTAGFQDTSFIFSDQGTKNQILANYNNFIYNYYNQTGQVIPNSVSLTSIGGLRNGDDPSNIYSLYNAQGSRTGGFSKVHEQMFRLTGQTTAEIGGHNIKLGFEFDQRFDRFYSLNAGNLWTYMRQLANRHLSQLDTANPILVTSGGEFQDTVRFNPLYVEADQSTFDRNLRTKLGMNPRGTEFINIDGLSPNQLSLDLFSANELWNSGTNNALVDYAGYDYLGNRVRNSNARGYFDADKQNTRPLNAFSPTYIAGYIQDKFEFRDIIFNVGVRVDRFDANQLVLKDKYLLYPAYTAEEALQAYPNMFPDGQIPGNIGKDWIPYVSTSDFGGDAKVVGYRNGDTWYDASGAPVASNLLQTATGKVQPVIKDNKITGDAFKDYEAQVNIMPRISFSFPISDQALFFANYDVLTQRPQTNVFGQLTDFTYLQNNATTAINNPALKPTRNIQYEAGFMQAVGKNVRITASAFYRELRNMIQQQQLLNAYPITYTTFTNLDFGTVKGFIFDIDFRRFNNLQLKGSYTLSFATGTGSSATSGRSASNSVDGFNAIRVLLPLDFDQRHQFRAIADYRFISADNKLGPKIFGGHPFKDAGANFTFLLGSGTPYSRNSLANSADVQFGINQSIQLQGTPNGSRTPFQIRCDLRLDKDFIFGGADIRDKDNVVIGRRHEYSLNIFLLVLNVFDTQNILSVYRTSGLPNDDGFLNTNQGRNQTAAQINPTSFTQLYQIKAQNPSNYSIPRRFRIGCSFNF